MRTWNDRVEIAYDEAAYVQGGATRGAGGVDAFVGVLSGDCVIADEM